MVCTTSASAGSPGVVCTSTNSAFGGTGLLSAGGLFSTEISELAPVLNADFSLALGDPITPASHVSVGFRFDGYWDAIKTVNSAGALANQDRLYYGPFLRLSTNF